MTRLIGLAGWSGAGKTTLIIKLIPALKARGYSVSTVKHAHHKFDIDKPGKDSYQHREAGAEEVLIASSKRWALMHEGADGEDPRLGDLLPHLGSVDLILVEGFKHEAHAKIEVHRAANEKPLLYPDDPTIRAIATDAADLNPDTNPPLPHAHLDDTQAIADFVLHFATPLTETLPLLQKRGSPSWRN